MRKPLCVLFTAAIMIWATAAEAKRDPEARLAEITKGRTAGEPVDCIQQIRISSTEIVDRTAIVYKMNDGTIYVNRPASGATFLSKGDVLVTNTHSNQLCSIDIVRLVSNGTHMPAGSVGLGKFVPYRRR